MGESDCVRGGWKPGRWNHPTVERVSVSSQFEICFFNFIHRLGYSTALVFLLCFHGSGFSHVQPVASRGRSWSRSGVWRGLGGSWVWVTEVDTNKMFTWKHCSPNHCPRRLKDCRHIKNTIQIPPFLIQTLCASNAFPFGEMRWFEKKQTEWSGYCNLSVSPGLLFQRVCSSLDVCLSSIPVSLHEYTLYSRAR